MLDVDGHVIAADELVRRVKSLVGAIDGESISAPDKSMISGDGGLGERSLRDPLKPMQAMHTELFPKPIGTPSDPRGLAGSFVKRVIRKLTRWDSEPRWTAQQHYDGHNILFAYGVADALERMQQELERLRKQDLHLKMQTLRAVERLRENFATKDEVRMLGHELERAGTTGVGGADIDYVAFEDRCRGSSEELRESQAQYLSQFPPPGEGKIVDIGCGRGEMLEVLIEAGYDVVGVDLNTEMVQDCSARGLPVTQDDALHFLGEIEDDSLRGVFCAQVVEHLLTSEVERLVQLCSQKLLPNGVMVVETINPRSSFALGNHFYADTSHVKPVHPETLRFICEQVGFSSVHLQERSPHPVMEALEDLPEDEVGSAVKELLRNVFGFQDYAIIATK